MEQSIFSEAWTLDGFRDALSREDNIFLSIESGEKIAGYCMTAKSYSTEYGGVCVWIEDLCLAPEYRGRGYGSKMLQYVEDRFRDKAVRLRLEVEPENRQAVAAYRKFGFHDLPYGQMTKEYPKLKEPR